MYDTAYKGFATTVATTLTALENSWVIPVNPFDASILPALEIWMNAVASTLTATSTTSVATTSVSNAQAVFDSAKPALVAALQIVPPELLAYAISWLDGLAAAAQAVDGATYVLDTVTNKYTVTYANNLTATVSAGAKAANEKLIADAAKFANWPQLKTEFVKVINAVITDAQTLADTALSTAQGLLATQKANDIAAANAALKLVSDRLNGTPATGGTPPLVHPETACSAGTVVVCDGSAAV